MRKKVAEWDTFGTVDCWYFIAFCHFFFLPPGAGFLIAFFELCKCESVADYAVRKKALRLILCILFGFLGLAVPETFIFIHVFFICFFMKKMRGLAAVAMLFFLWKIPESRENMGLFCNDRCIWIFTGTQCGSRNFA